MATKYWLGVADAVAQVSTVQITAYDAATTYTLTTGGVAISVVGTTDANGTASALSTAWNASTHPYCAAVTASVATDTVTLTADTAGAPFVTASSVTSGTGTIGSVTAGTVSSGPNDWSTAANWSDGSIPGNSDTIYFRENSVNVCWGLAQSSVTLDDLFIEKTYTGKIGLDRSQFATSADGDTLDNSKPEYRDHYLDIDVDRLEIGKHVGGGTATGSARIKIDNANTGACDVFVYGTANVAAESTLSAVRLILASSSANVNVRSGSVGIAIDDPTETTTVGNVRVPGRNAKVFIGSGTTITNLYVTDGDCLLQAAATVTLLDIDGGIVTTEGEYTITTLTINGGTCYCNNSPAGNAITTANLNGGILSGRRSSDTRTWATVNLDIGATMQVNPDDVTITTLNEPTSAGYSMTIS